MVGETEELCVYSKLKQMVEWVQLCFGAGVLRYGASV